MSNNIDYLIGCIHREIPTEILNRAFLPPNGLGQLTPNLDHYIHQEVIANWVLVDCNLVAGIETIIDITGVKRELVNSGMIFHVGLGPTGGRTITSVLSIGYGFNIVAGGQPGIASALTQPLQTSDARCQLVGHNVVYVEGYTGIQLTNLRCVLENDTGFNNVSPRALPLLSELVINAAKAYIYKHLTIRLGTGVIVGGVDTGRITDIVNGYSDANQAYRDLLPKWQKTNFMSDRVSMNRHIRMLTPS